MGRLCSVDGEILFRWGRLCSDTESPGATSFQPRRESVSGETLFHDTGCKMYCVADLLCAQSALEFCPIHCPNGRLGQDLGFGGFAFALKLPELLNRNLAAVRAKLG